MRKITVKGIFKWLSLGIFLACSCVILAESAVDGQSSADKSNTITDIVQGVIDNNHDNNTIIDIKDFDLLFSDDEYKPIYNPGDFLSYSVNYVPKNTSYLGLEFIPSDEETIKINEEEQKIYFLKAGDASIKVKSTKKSEIEHNYSFIIEDIQISEIKLDTSSIEIKEYETYQINPILIPKNATDTEIYFVSSNINVAQVDENNGLVSAVAPGECDIKITYKSDENIYSNLHVKVDSIESTNYEVSSLKIDNDLGIISLNETTKKVIGRYESIHANFDINELKISFENNPEYFTISKKELTSAGFFEFSIILNTNISGIESTLDFTSNIIINYKNLAIAHSKINYKKLKKITINEVAKTQNSYSFYYTKYEKYNTSNNIIKDNAVLKAKFTSSFKYKEYSLKNFKWDLDSSISSSFTISSESYSSITLKPKSEIPVSGFVYYYPDKDDLENKVTINFTYENATSDSKIENLNLTKFNDSGEKNTLILNHEYLNFFSYKIKATGSNEKNNAYLEKTKISYTCDDDNKVNIFTNQETGTLSLIPLSEGQLKITIYSEIEKTIGIKDSEIKKIEYQFDIKAYESNYGKITINELEYEESDIPEKIEIQRGEAMTFSLATYYKQSFKDGTSELIDIENKFNFEILNNEEESIYQIENSPTIIGIKANDNNDLSVKITGLNSSYQKIIRIQVVYVPIKVEEFRLTFEILSETNDYSFPDDDFSFVPINSQFKVSAKVNDDATNKGVSFYSSDEEVITISQENGLAIAKKYGTTIITALSNDDPTIKIEKEMKVLNIASDFFLEQSDNGFNPLSLKEINDENGNFLFYEAELDYGRPYVLKINPEYHATSTNITYTHEDYYGETVLEPVVSIDSSGSITTNNIGDDRLKITFGKTDSIKSYTKYLKIKVLRNTFFTYSQLGYLIRKSLGHFGLFAVTALFSVIFILLAFNRNLYRIFAILASFIIGVFLAIGSEIIQSITPGRYCTIQDMLIDSLGYLTTLLCAIGFIILTVIIKRIHRYYKKRKAEKT